MIELIVKKGNLFEHINETDYYVHACNGKGVWGSGIAKTFHQKFPEAYQQYKNSKLKVGKTYIVEEANIKIGCLITSKGFGKYVDNPVKIINKTKQSIIDFLNQIKEKDVIIHSPKINAGLFKVPWEYTEEAIKNSCNKFPDLNIKWIVWEL